MTQPPVSDDMGPRVRTPRGLAGERKMSWEGAIPDAVFAEPWFGRNRAGFGLLAGRNTLIEVSVGPETREIRIGRFTGTRRRPTTAAGVASVLGMTVADTERLFNRIERALRAGIAAYQKAYMDTALEPPGEILSPFMDAQADNRGIDASASADPKRIGDVVGPEGPGPRSAQRRRAAPEPAASISATGQNDASRPTGPSL